MISGLDHLQIEAPPGHEAQARAFYGDFLGLSELERPLALQPSGGVWFALPGGQQLHMGTVSDFSPRKKGHPCFRCTDLNVVLAWARSFGIEVQEDAQLAPLHRVFLHDPFGNRLEIVEGEHLSVML